MTHSSVQALLHQRIQWFSADVGKLSQDFNQQDVTGRISTLESDYAALSEAVKNEQDLKMRELFKSTEALFLKICACFRENRPFPPDVAPLQGRLEEEPRKSAAATSSTENRRGCLGFLKRLASKIANIVIAVFRCLFCCFFRKSSTQSVTPQPPPRQSLPPSSILSDKPRATPVEQPPSKEGPQVPADVVPSSVKPFAQSAMPQLSSQQPPPPVKAQELSSIVSVEKTASLKLEQGKTQSNPGEEPAISQELQGDAKKWILEHQFSVEAMTACLKDPWADPVAGLQIFAGEIWKKEEGAASSFRLEESQEQKSQNVTCKTIRSFLRNYTPPVRAAMVVLEKTIFWFVGDSRNNPITQFYIVEIFKDLDDQLIAEFVTISSDRSDLEKNTVFNGIAARIGNPKQEQVQFFNLV